jgi:hypothetical protein
MYFSKLYSSTLIQEIKILRALPQATAFNRHNTFTLTLPLSERRAGEAWEHPDNMMRSFLSPL